MIMVILDRNNANNNTVIVKIWMILGKEPWSTCSHTCKPKHASSNSFPAVRTRRVNCVDDKKRQVQVQLCEQTAEKPKETEVREFTSSTACTA